MGIDAWSDFVTVGLSYFFFSRRPWLKVLEHLKKIFQFCKCWKKKKEKIMVENTQKLTKIMLEAGNF